jgi:hypothetical protein
MPVQEITCPAFFVAGQVVSLEAAMQDSTHPSNGGGRRYLTTKQAADYVGLSHRTMEAMRGRGDGPPYVKHGGPRSGLALYLLEDLDEWLLSRRRMSTSDFGSQR